MGSTIVREIIIIISIQTMMWRWKERYCTASGPHFIKKFSSFILNMAVSHEQKPLSM